MVFKHQHFHETSPEVEAEFPPSATLEGAVSDALASAGGIDASDVAVIASGSEITLSGTVQLESEIARAEEVALGVAGVATVRNGLRFTRPR
ncbi:BON domain-containing protein [Neorhizobium galegae]|uniref:BON domain-containing protein n=1 Tax=Neorhizobium galegae TaxID=399 RepID=UPI001F2B2D9F|nr:BON domain-containing protein [Neorhizobium galegae]UIK04467.1 BON domain-containing protein [Neorhizobium galegae]